MFQGTRKATKAAPAARGTTLQLCGISVSTGGIKWFQCVTGPGSLKTLTRDCARVDMLAASGPPAAKGTRVEASLTSLKVSPTVWSKEKFTCRVTGV